jgi:ppGpp synthetase/RelA/SpoT-type nucleotidyltranferase
MDRTEFLRFRRSFDRVLRQILLDLEFFIEDLSGINVYAVTHRLKTFESALEKSQRLNKLKIEKMQDIAGIRIVVATLDEIDVIVRFFSRKADSKDLIIKSDKVISRKDGYRARHLVLEFSAHYSRSIYPAFVEVQILTLLQNTFNYISRAWIYKANRELTDEWHSNFQKLSIDLAEIDQRIAQLQKQVIDSSVSSAPDDPLTPFSYQQIVMETFKETIQINDAVDDINLLIDVGCDTNGKLQSFFGRDDILQMREQIMTIESPVGKAFAKSIVTEMPVYEFYVTFGIRVEATQELIQKLNQFEVKNEENLSLSSLSLFLDTLESLR